MPTATISTDKDVKINQIMEDLLKSRPRGFLKAGDVVDGEVIKKQGARLYLNLKGFGTGIVYGKEYQNAREIIKTLKTSAVVSGKIVALENEDGFIELSLKEAGSEMIWKEATLIKANQDIIDLKVLDSNKGGLVFEWKSIKGFLPASQLKATHYPRVEGGDKDKISEELKKLVGETLSVTILDFEPKEEKLIFTEKGASGSEEIKKIIEKYKVGDVVEGDITGVVEFGIFIKIEEGLEGLAHISELDWGLVESPSALFKVGDKIKAKIISVESDKISLSVKALKPDPWELNKEKYKKGDIVEGKVLRLNKFGALIFLQAGIYGLAHISEFGTEKRMRELVEAGQTYMFQIAVFHPEDRKLSLSFLGKDGQVPADLKPPKKEEAKEEKKEDESK
ncbi:MAG: RNA binding S1 domain protein [Candidatus Giovannonibacteria bacterium GW2011_GWA2_44_13b]|uniref:RNA binding S1 domain protein n=2 Tax=Candidatus Giovannoniibacteriota TaxID=1752738 RepID=A0A0G1H0R4_9BACT|nr:MAG: RNA binding S1 domain protein [Candidatus Giovannonibacteria bacterium GW2011_GWA2_44_13b]OGF83114.1 MAG: hypothetical protein A2924_04015 [Candidatus Giovannonibacteria bacterium RIFCSPLOWO2_01_FULL_44_16]